uniref:Putative secreted peptide n=1 Tax=Anopheles braziliensis TaxID=58242 RepID=A0A2M3ZV40_9DIPT
MARSFDFPQRFSLNSLPLSIFLAVLSSSLPLSLSRLLCASLLTAAAAPDTSPYARGHRDNFHNNPLAAGLK